MPTLYLLSPDTPEKRLVKKLDYAPNGDYSLPLAYDGFLLYEIEGVKWKIKKEGYLFFLNFHTDYTSPISIYCVVTDSTGGTATTNRCQLRVGTSASQTQVSTKQIEPVRIYNGSKFLYGIPFIYNSGWKYNSWNITK